MRGVTLRAAELTKNVTISTHTPHARRDDLREQSFFHHLISTHTPHARRDHSQVYYFFTNVISTHTPHARRDVGKSDA